MQIVVTFRINVSVTYLYDSMSVLETKRLQGVNIFAAKMYSNKNTREPLNLGFKALLVFLNCIITQDESFVLQGSFKGHHMLYAMNTSRYKVFIIIQERL